MTFTFKNLLMRDNFWEVPEHHFQRIKCSFSWFYGTAINTLILIFMNIFQIKTFLKTFTINATLANGLFSLLTAVYFSLSASNSRKMVIMMLHGQCLLDSAHWCCTCLCSFSKRQSLEMINYLFNSPFFPELKLIQSRVSENNVCPLGAKDSFQIALYIFSL